MKLIFNLIKLSILALVLALIFHNWTVKQALRLVLSYQLGAPVEIDRARIDLFKAEVEFKDILIHQPEAFNSREILADIPQIFVDFDWPAIWEGRLHLQAVELNVNELNLIRNPDGRLNLLSFKVFQQAGKKGGEKPRREDKTPQVKLDRVILA